MRVDTDLAEQIAEVWLAQTLDSYPAAVRSTLVYETDPFRNPAGFAIKASLQTLTHEVLGAMNKRAIEPALDALMRLRAVQDFSSADAIEFIFDLRAAVTRVAGSLPPDFDTRVDELARIAFVKYSECRTQIATLCAKEKRLRTQYRAAEQATR